MSARCKILQHSQRILVVVICLLFLDIALAQGLTPSAALRKEFWDTDGTIQTILATNGIVYVGGSFSYVAPKGSKLISIDPFTGATEQGFPAFYGTAINIIIEDGNGGWFVGGNFNMVGNVPRTNLVHVLSDNTVDPFFQPNPNGSVHALALEGQKLYIGGDFSSCASQPRSKLAAWDFGNQLLLPWTPEANGIVSTLLVSGNAIYAGGYFTQISGQPRRNIASIESVSGLVLPWSPQADGAVLTMDLQDETLYIGGFFNRVGGQLRNGLAALDLNSTNALNWDPNPVGGKVTRLKVECNTVYVTGYFTNIAGVARFRAGAVDANTGEATAWNANLDLLYSANLPSFISGLAVSGERVYLGGEFSRIGGQPVHDLAVVNATTGELLPWNPNLNGGVSTIAVAGRRVLAGIITAVGGVERRNIAAFSETNGSVLPFAALVNGPVYSLAFSNGKLFLGGEFDEIDGSPRLRLGAVDANSGFLLTDWMASANGTVYTLATDNSSLYVGGNFTLLNGSTRLRLGAINTVNGQNQASWTAHADGTVYALELLGPNLYAGGSFVSLGGFTRHRLAALSRVNGAVQPWNPDANQIVRTLRSDGATIYAGGNFTSIGGQPRSHLAAVNSTSGALTSWNPGADDEVWTLSVAGNYVFIGGIFLHVGGLERLGCAGVGLDGSLLDWNPGVSQGNRIYASASSSSGLYFGGDFPLDFGSGSGSHTLVAFPPEGFPTIVQAPLDTEAKVGNPFLLSVVVSGELPMTYSWRFNGTTVLSNNTGSLFRIAQTGGSGLYEVTISNRWGQASARATLTVLEPVFITTQPVSQTLSNGTSVTLSVEATGSPPPIFQWRVNGVNVPGAVFPSLTLSNVSPASGGSYYVVAGNRDGAINSAVAQIDIADSNLPFGDNLEDRGTISGLAGHGTGDNSFATREANEPYHAQKAGGKSLWVSWIAGADGLATFSTRGSAFDTLLAVYVGTNLSNLIPVASDEDRGGFLTSQLSFNAEAGVEYLIAVDGLAGASGPIALSWTLDPTSTPSPQITGQPNSQSVTFGGVATFHVEATGSGPLSYQWFFGCREIHNATNSTLTISNVGLRHVGSYHVFVMNGSNKIAESVPASLEISSFPGVLSFDKLEDLLTNGTNGGNSFGPKAFSVSGTQPLLVSMGTIISQTFDTSSGTSFIKETNHCGVIGGASAWIRFKPAQDGTVLVDTLGSFFDTVLAIYRDTNLTVLATNPSAALVDCDNNGAPDHIRSQLQFQTKSNEVYLAVVDGVLSAKGIANIHWQLGTKPFITNSTLSIVGDLGKAVTLHSGVSSTTIITTYQWFFNGAAISGATNSTLTLTNLISDQAGTYSVLASNFVGAVLNHAASVTVNMPLHFGLNPKVTGGQFETFVWGNTNQMFVLQGSTNLTDWVSVATNTILSNPSTVIDRNAGQSKTRFYRIRSYP